MAGAYEEWTEDGMGVSSGKESGHELMKMEGLVSGIGAEGVNAVAVAYYKAC